MRILVVTPLYPPEIAEPAPYVKELVTRLAAQHEVTLLAYTHLPEKVPGVRMLTVEKRRVLPLRLLSFFFALSRASRNADMIYAMNGMSVELPVFLTSFLPHRQVVLACSDPVAVRQAQTRWLARLVAHLAQSRARACIHTFPFPRPEIIPFEPYPSIAFSSYEHSWSEHLELLHDTFTHA
ncbi:MAG: hypothetical protein AAB442_03660 [Patescibacteria group bacterium]